MTTEPDPFKELFASLAAGDQEAARLIYLKFVGQLVGLAEKKLRPSLGHRADPDSVAQSAFLSFFRRAGDYQFHNWAMVYGFLAHVTLLKCLNRIRDRRRESRDDSRVVAFADWQEVRRITPGPDEEVMLAELLGRALAASTAGERVMIDAVLAGERVAGVAARLKVSTRTVERAVADFRGRLEKLLEVGR